MKTSSPKFKMSIVILIAVILMAATAVYLFPGWVDRFMEKMNNGGAFSSIVYAFLFIVGFNLIIFLIGRFSNGRNSTTQQIRKMKRVVKTGRAKRAEIRQAHFKMGQT